MPWPTSVGRTGCERAWGERRPSRLRSQLVGIGDALEHFELFAPGILPRDLAARPHRLREVGALPGRRLERDDEPNRHGLSSRAQSVSTSIITCPLPRQPRPGMGKDLPRVEFRVVPEDALLVEGNAARRGAPPGRELLAMVGQAARRGVAIWATVRGKAAVKLCSGASGEADAILPVKDRPR